MYIYHAHDTYYWYYIDIKDKSKVRGDFWHDDVGETVIWEL